MTYKVETLIPVGVRGVVLPAGTILTVHPEMPNRMGLIECRSADGAFSLPVNFLQWHCGPVDDTAAAVAEPAVAPGMRFQLSRDLETVWGDFSRGTPVTVMSATAQSISFYPDTVDASADTVTTIVVRSPEEFASYTEPLDEPRPTVEPVMVNVRMTAAEARDLQRLLNDDDASADVAKYRRRRIVGALRDAINSPELPK